MHWCTSPALLLLLLAGDLSADAAPPDNTPEARALAFLAREVPRWTAEHDCFSCHNNGDAARALYHAAQRSWPVPDQALSDTTAWLSQPQRWVQNGTEGEFNDLPLARLQFGSALVASDEAGLLRDRQALTTAAQLVAADQLDDGSWQVQTGSTIGSAVIYNPPLATHLARRILEAADRRRFREPIARAEAYLLSLEPVNVTSAAAVLWALQHSDDPRAGPLRQKCLAIIRQGEASGGGWGPYVTSAPEPFDTGLVLLALSTLPDRHHVAPLLKRGRAWLAATQEPDGGWPATTRPPGADSYAQRISTTGWAAQGLIATSSAPLLDPRPIDGGAAVQPR